MRLSMPVPYAATADGFARTAKQLSTLEQAGLDIAWVAEAYGFDAPSLMGYLAATTERLEIGSGILPICNAYAGRGRSGADHRAAEELGELKTAQRNIVAR